MNLPYLLSDAVQQFIQQYFEENINTLSLKHASKLEHWNSIAYQLTGKKKAKSKIPTWHNTPYIVYPENVSIEQCSSEPTALYKSELVEGKSLIDLTGGLGVDDYYFAKKISEVFHCELNEELSAIVQHNYKQLKVSNITCINQNSELFLKNVNRTWDWIYIDPSRRDTAKNKVFLLEDCSPNVVAQLNEYLKYTPKLLIKVAPLLDIQSGIQALQYIKRIHIVALENEVKELLWEIEKGYEKDIEVVAVNLKSNHKDVFTFHWNEQKNKSCPIGQPLTYLYEPNAAIMKSGGFTAVANTYNLIKLHPHSHLYTSNEKINFPGRVFKIVDQFSYKKKEMENKLKNSKINLSTRNFPETVNEIKSKWKIKDGGHQYCFMTTNHLNEKIVLIGEKV
jgi:hypothetical protein